MINFIIYEDEQYYLDLYYAVIQKFMGFSTNQYRVYTYLEYSDEMMKNIKSLVGQNIYILDIEVKNKSGLDLAREIRTIKKTMNDQIIIVTAHQELVASAYHKKILMMDFISKFDDISNQLLMCLYEVYEIFNNNKYLSFKRDSEIIRIPYNDILFIEKDKVKDCLFIVTAHNKISYNGNITKLEDILKDDRRFFKTHRSCIVNVFKITKIEPSVPAIYFKNKYTNCLSRDKRKELEEMCIVGGNKNEC